jgi:hypothetical protein
MRLVFALLALVACGDSAPPARTEVSIAPAPTATATASATASVAPVASSATPDASAAAVLDELHEGMADGGLVVLGALQGGPDVRAAIGVDGGAPFGSGTLTTGFGGGGSGSGSGRIHGSAGTHASHVRQGATAVSGSMPPEIIRRVVRAHYGHVRACYAKAPGSHRGEVRDRPVRPRLVGREHAALEPARQRGGLVRRVRVPLDALPVASGRSRHRHLPADLRTRELTHRFGRAKIDRSSSIVPDAMAPPSGQRAR